MLPLLQGLFLVALAATVGWLIFLAWTTRHDG
jgi:hypothetical protein